MKKLALLAVCLVSAAAVYAADGTFSFGNKVTAAAIDAPISDALGTKLADTAYLAQLWVGATAGNLVAVGDAVPFRTGAAAGYIKTVDRTIPFPAGQEVFVQFRAWRAAAGATWDAAKNSLDANPAGNWGELATPLKLASGGVPDPVTGIPGFPANLTGLSSFKLVAVPEPSTIALGVLGAAVLFLRRRK